MRGTSVLNRIPVVGPVLTRAADDSPMPGFSQSQSPESRRPTNVTDPLSNNGTKSAHEANLNALVFTNSVCNKTKCSIPLPSGRWS